MIGLDAQFNPFVFYNLEQSAIAPKQTLIIPNGKNPWQINKPLGTIEVLLVCSLSPFVKTLKVLQDIVTFKGIRPLPKALELAQALLADLHYPESLPSNNSLLATENYILDVRRWATFSFIYQVVEKPIE